MVYSIGQTAVYRITADSVLKYRSPQQLPFKALKLEPSSPE